MLSWFVKGILYFFPQPISRPPLPWLFLEGKFNSHLSCFHSEASAPVGGCVCVSPSFLSGSATLWTRVRLPFLSWDSPGQNTGVGSRSLFQGIFPTQGSNPSLLHCRRILCHLSHYERPLCVLSKELWNLGVMQSMNLGSKLARLVVCGCGWLEVGGEQKGMRCWFYRLA